MRFNCDYFKNIQDQRYLEYIAESSKWRKWFAWYPVKIRPGLCVWLEIIERRSYFADVTNLRLKVRYGESVKYRFIGEGE